MTSIVAVVAALIIIAIDVPHLKRNKFKKELWIFTVLLLIGVGLSIAHSFHITLPNPIRGMNMIFQPFSNFMYELLT
ncbi:MAG TPA: hypothetical protein VNM69_11065 [Bacillus sp. (in: firmicutes)]|uniref:hypothetical protein n=1 Tax=Bacillus litorisediminis TaxID=2922713 RepID=UPI001FAF7B4A|nr:hypothetical protein [Bacillus litorisediminis]HWO76419.1 hypothetical protein [Bacillus sp. (in: firmicutes)]